MVERHVGVTPRDVRTPAPEVPADVCGDVRAPRRRQLLRMGKAEERPHALPRRQRGGPERPVARRVGEVSGGGSGGDFDAERLRAALTADRGRLGPLGFLERRIAPLVQATGEWWIVGTTSGCPQAHRNRRIWSTH